MRVVTVIGVLLAGGAATLTAQHAHQLEFGGFTSWTRYDRAFGLNNTFDSWKSLGFGGRIGYFLSDYVGRSEEHTSELQSRLHLVCRLLLEKKKKKNIQYFTLINDLTNTYNE